jgi:ubiquinone/menaquinone biosynthesis C-methylase UbiE
MTFYPYAGARDPRAFAITLAALDPARAIDAAVWSAIAMSGPLLLDVGAGSGVLALRYAERARHVFALEPDHRMLAQIHAALATAGELAGRVSVLAAGAEAVPLPDAAVDVVHARYAYFFGTDACLPGLAEARRVLRPGGSMVVIEGSNEGEMGRLNAANNPAWFADQARLLQFWREQGFAHRHIMTTWRVPDRESMHAAFAFEWGDQRASEMVASAPGLELSYGSHLFHWRKPSAS